MIEPTYSGEVRFVRSSFTSKNGATVVLALPDIAELERVQGMDGKRYMLALVQIGDDEQPVQPPKVEKPKGGYAAKWLAMRCGEQAFWDFLSDRLPSGAIRSTQDAAEMVREICGVKSRAEIDNDQAALVAFHAHIRVPYMKFLATHGHTAPEVEHA